MVLIVQNAHFIHDDDDGHSLLHMLQQRAEAWAQAGVLTMVCFSFLPFFVLHRLSFPSFRSSHPSPACHHSQKSTDTPQTPSHRSS